MTSPAKRLLTGLLIVLTMTSSLRAQAPAQVPDTVIVEKGIEYANPMVRSQRSCAFMEEDFEPANAKVTMG